MAGDPPKPPSRRSDSPWALVGAGMEFGAVVAAMTLGGWWLDRRWQTAPVLMFVGLAVSLIGGTYNLWRKGKRYFDR